MVPAGTACAKYGPDYVQEERARSLRLGVHLHGCQPAWLWRRDKRGTAHPNGKFEVDDPTCQDGKTTISRSIRPSSC